MPAPTTHATIDAYSHVGLPRFSTAEDALATLGLLKIRQAVLVLGPDVPDYAAIFDAANRYGDRVRTVGIPFGRTQQQVRQIVDLQIAAGVMGLRIQNDDHLTDPAVLEMLGKKGRWLYGINVLRSREILHALLNWLDRYPDARLAAPHFVRPNPLLDGSADDSLKRELLGHPGFYAIFSRHGGNGSREPYPHGDYRPWVEQVIELAGWDRILWGSEYPVLFWRNESVANCRNWLQNLLPGVKTENLRGFLGDNAARAIFSTTPPPSEPVRIPDWVEDQFNRKRTVPLFASQGLEPPMVVYARLHHAYVARLQDEPDLTFAQFLIDRLGSDT